MQKKTDLNTIIGLGLIFVLFLIWSKLYAPKIDEKPTENPIADTTQVDQPVVDTNTKPLVEPETSPVAANDSLQGLLNQRQYGDLAPAFMGENQDVTLENDVMKVTFSTKGGAIKKVFLKDHVKTVILDPKTREKAKVPVTLFDNPANQFDYQFSLNGASDKISTSKLFFKPTLSGKTLTLTAQGANGVQFQQIYTLKDGDYEINYKVKMPGLASKINGPINLHIEDYLNKLELPAPYGEKRFATVHYKPLDGDSEHLSKSKADKESFDKPVKWVALANQFFNTTIISDESFPSVSVEVEPMDAESESLKLVKSDIVIPAKEVINMEIYTGPNEFNRLRSYGMHLEDIVPFGNSIFGSINRWVIRPMFDFLHGIVGSVGLAILLLTLFVKLAVYPLTLKSLKSQAKMRALKPELDKLKKKYGDDQQGYSAASMKLYQEFGVSPLGGCFPMMLQMPIWFALYRFFPGAINFRQKSFLWADDLSTYDDLIHFSHKIPIFGDHISLFTLLWVISILIYTWYNSKQVDMTQGNPMMKYIQYIMPLTFLFVLNSYAAGLTAYMLFSNTFNIAQTLITKQFVIDDDKVRAEVLKNKDKPKKKGRFSGFQEKMAKAVEEQRKIQEQQKKGKK
ncbi:MAG TPA: membrane protein insertase YidC [Saprospiraceae bacterium]|nr:membrane protein insertase YidC [Saprospiraceae bacterium]